MHDQKRNSGRTTGLLLKAIADAILSPGKPAVFRDHWSCESWQRACLYRYTLVNMLEDLGLSGIELEACRDGSVRLTYSPAARTRANRTPGD